MRGSDKRSSRLLAIAAAVLTCLLASGCGAPGGGLNASSEKSAQPGQASRSATGGGGDGSGPGSPPPGPKASLFNFNVAMYLAADLRRDGARVVLTRRNNHGIGPCVDKRSTMLNHTDVAIDIHADGGPPGGRGFTVLEPVADGPNNKVIASSVRFGRYVHQAFLADTPMRVSDYYGRDGYQFRDDLAGLNLTTVPKVLIECGNMPNQADAALLSSARVQREIAQALEAAIVRFLTGKWLHRH